MARRPGQLIQKGENKWLTRVFLGRNEKGKRQYHSRTIRGTKRDAQRYLNGVLRDIDLGIFAEPSAMTLNAYLDKWLATIEPKVRRGTHRGYSYALSGHVRPVLGNKQLSRIKALDIQEIYSALLAKDLTANTVLHVHGVISMALKQAVKWGILKSNPCDLVELPRIRRKEMQALSPEQTQKFLQSLDDDDYRPLLIFAILTGMRPNEYLGLQWKDVDLSAAVVRVQRTMQRLPGGGWEYGDTKTASAKRTITLPSSLVTILAEHKRHQAEHRLKHADVYESNDLVFASFHGGPLNHEHIRLRFRSALKKAGLPEKMRLYDLRHSCATLLLAAGENPKVVSERLGHANVSLTLNVYSHVLPTMQQAAAERLEKLVFDGAGTPLAHQS